MRVGARCGRSDDIGACFCFTHGILEEIRISGFGYGLECRRKNIIL